ncbi:MAG: hypothetical protein ABH950_01000 [Candidatus Altiarchaeota archaeon]
MASALRSSLSTATSIFFAVRFISIFVLLLFSYCFWILLDGFVLRGFLALIPALFAAQLFLNDILESYLTFQLNRRSKWFTLMIAPGTILHELCHLFAAVVTGCRILDVSLFRRNPKTNVLGYVSYSQRKDKWTVFRDLFIGFAPFFGCGLMLLVIFGVIEEYTSLDLVKAPELDLDFKSLSELAVFFKDITGSFLAQFALLTVYPLLWILLYLELCFSLGSAPSSQDFKGVVHSIFWHPISGFFLLALFGGFFYLVENPGVFGIYESVFLRAVTQLFSVIILILVASVVMLILSIPLIYFVPELAEIRGVTKYIPPIIFLVIYYTINNPIYAAGGFIISFVVVKYPGFYLEPKTKRKK